MYQFVMIFASFSFSLLGCSLASKIIVSVLGLPATGHSLIGLSAAILNVSVHCLIFAIFTGSGKDIRELVQHYELDRQFVVRTKEFKREIFPRALYAILLLVLTTSLGGLAAVSTHWTPIIRWAHFIFAWSTFFYSAKVFLLECRAVKENGGIIERVNKAVLEKQVMIDSIGPQTVDELQWGLDVYVLGKILIFLGYNLWLPYIYLRFAVGWFRLSVWPFLGISALCLSYGYYLRFMYQRYKPGKV